MKFILRIKSKTYGLNINKYAVLHESVGDTWWPNG